MLRLAAVLASPAAAAAVLIGAPIAQAEPSTATVTKVVDGDTVDVTFDNGQEDRVRILGIDTPETVHPNKPVECRGPEATTFAKQELLNRRVAVMTDSTQDERDDNDRLLAYLERDDSGWIYSVEAARAGVARNYVYDEPVQLQPQIAAAEQEAQDAGVGLWGPPCNGGR
ncbi:thermonuclease family protein [Nocardia sp. NPDC019395]|uniref:thermonuclease family protein n=1 Tax=Nocardia sp. NPDC019395 TaxID=3154686 RepID=UPI0033CBE403